jgi:hypothetical protein
MLFLDQVMIQPLSGSNNGLKIERNTVFSLKKILSPEIHRHRHWRLAFSEIR